LAIVQNNFENAEHECVKMFLFADDLMSSISEKCFLFSTLLSFGNSHKLAGSKSGEDGG
jgi:hypothetical protein